MTTSRSLEDAPVVAQVVRGGVVESVHRGLVVGLDAAGEIAISAGDPAAVVFPRSSNKPLQAVAMLRLGLDLDGELLALAAASHSGEPFHVEGARRILASAGLDESALQCPPAWPMEPEDLAAYAGQGGVADRLHMNCSGKHAAMLATCVANGWPTETYRDPAHPLQQSIKAVVEELAGERVSATVVDGCGAPLFAFSLLGLARAFRALALGPVGSNEHRVCEAYRAHPEWTSGTRREETAIMRSVSGLVNKAGADGVDALVMPDGRAVAVKIVDGGQRARQPVSVAALRALGVDAPELEALASVPVLGGGEPVGEIRAVWP